MTHTKNKKNSGMPEWIGGNSEKTKKIKKGNKTSETYHEPLFGGHNTKNTQTQAHESCVVVKGSQSSNEGDKKLSEKTGKKTQKNMDTLTHTPNKKNPLAKLSSGKTKIDIHLPKKTKKKQTIRHHTLIVT